MPEAQQIQAMQGTRLSETNPWDSYESEMLGESISKELAAEIADYASRRYEDAPVSSETQEQLCELREGNANVAQEYQWLTPDEYEDEAARIGKPMFFNEFIHILRKVGLNCHYRQHPHADKAVLYVSKSTFEEPKNACWVQINAPMPELSIMKFDQYGAPLAERKRGWRTCLLQLILQGFISEADANKYFGKPGQGKAFDRYNSTLKSFRDAGNSLN